MTVSQKKKIYAVRIGRKVGLFYSWKECLESVSGFKSAEYCGFYTKEEAERYLNGEDLESECDIPENPPDTVIAFVDGSFDISTVRYSFGCILLYPDGSREELSGTGDNRNAVSSRNVAGELLGTMTAMKKTAEKGYRKMIIYHDYEGISAWFQKRWKANSWVALEYLRFSELYRSSMDIKFVKVEAHTGNTLNERADVLAKEALGICSKGK